MLTITVWLKEKDFEKFKKFYDDVNNERQIDKKDIPEIELKTSQPTAADGEVCDWLQLNVLYEIYFIMKEFANND